MQEHRIIAVDGPIGVGKSSLAKMLAARLGAEARLDEPNPFLNKFYKDRRAHAFETQLFFLLSRYQQLHALRQGDLFRGKVVLDYLFEKDRLFARLNLESDELALYDKVYTMLGGRVAVPDLVIYLYADLEVLMERLEKRRREKGGDFPHIPEDYLRQVMDAYNRFFFDYTSSPLLVVNTNHLDFEKREKDLDELISKMETVTSGVQYWIPMIDTLT